jgi:hypothetical protein
MNRDYSLEIFDADCRRFIADLRRFFMSRLGRLEPLKNLRQSALNLRKSASKIEQPMRGLATLTHSMANE